MCKWYRRPKSRGKRKVWLKRYLSIHRKQLLHGFCEAWYRGRHFTVAAQVKDCLAKIRRAEQELVEVLAA